MNPADLLDFSANINPAAPPVRVLERLQRDAQDIALLTRYPDTELFELRSAIARHHQVEPANIVIAGGSAALLDAAFRTIAPRRGLLPVPAFSEYYRSLRAFGCDISRFLLLKENDFQLETAELARKLKFTQSDFSIVNNPHNPFGALIERADLEVLARDAAAGATVLLDEAFIDYQPDESLISLVTQYENLIVLRSVTKFYSILALRVGYAVAHENLARKLNRQIPSWSVITLAANAASEICREPDGAAARQICEQNEIEREWLGEQLTKINFKVYPSIANFLLLELPP